MPISRIGTDGIENGAVAPADLSTGGPYWDGSGNVGLQVTPSAWASGMKVLQFGNGTSIGSLAATYALFAQNYYYDGTNNIYLTTNRASLYAQDSGSHKWFNAPLGTAGTSVTLTQAMTLDANGNLMIAGATSAVGQLTLGSTGNIYCNGGATWYTGGDLYIRAGTSGTLHLGSNDINSRARITSDGRLLVGTASSSATLTVDAIDALSPGTISSYAISCGNTSGASLAFGSDVNFSYIQSFESKPLIINSLGNEVRVAGTADNGAYNFQCNGTGIWGAGAYVNGSDERIKEDIASIASGLDVVTKLNPVTYRYKEDWSKDQSTQTGFIAQELLVAMEGQNYVDGIVQQGGSNGYYSVAYQNIIPLLTKAIQELKAELDATKAEVAALKGAA